MDRAQPAKRRPGADSSPLPLLAIKRIIYAAQQQRFIFCPGRGKGLSPALAGGTMGRNHQAFGGYAELDDIPKTALGAEGFRDADSPGIADAGEFRSHNTSP